MNMQACAPYAAMVLVQLFYGGSNILMKIALEKGLNQLVFVVYRHIIAMTLLGTFAFVIERYTNMICEFMNLLEINFLMP